MVKPSVQKLNAPLMLGVGFRCCVTAAVAVPLQPVASVTVSIIFGSDAFSVTLVPVPPVDQL